MICKNGFYNHALDHVMERSWTDTTKAWQSVISFAAVCLAYWLCYLVLVVASLLTSFYILGLAIHTFHGNFFVRSTDLLSLPNINPDAGFGMQVSIEDNLTDSPYAAFQAALLYTSSKGEHYDLNTCSRFTCC